jgi:para-aminobenzoate synthetase component 1
MPTQELRLARTPTELLACAPWPRAAVFDGGGGDSWRRGYALFVAAPRATLRIDADGTARWDAQGVTRILRAHPLRALDQFHAACAAGAVDAPAAPFAGGLVTALSYDLKQWLETLPNTARDDQQLPIVEAAWYDWALQFDYRTRTWQLTSAFLADDALRAVGEWLVSAAQRMPDVTPAVIGPLASNFSRAQFHAAARKALEYIAAGDIYQVNLAQRFAAEIDADATTARCLFARLQQRHPMPFACYLDCGDFAVVSNSPECFLDLSADRVATWPIKGTRPRAADNARDVALMRALRRDPKERAEHVMIVDLERNDLGRFCEAGSVTVGTFAAVQSFPTLHHLVSEVHGRPRPGVGFADVLRAAFPGGSITGAPKIRAMEIIDELEPVRRGFYTGAIGFLAPDRTGVFNIPIRTAIARAGRLTYHAGGAIVADSDPDAEYEETMLKARAFFDASAARS